MDRVSDYEQLVLRHEGLHYLQDEFSHSITIRLDWWLDYRVNYPKIFKVEPDAFYRGWLAFAKKRCY